MDIPAVSDDPLATPAAPAAPTLEYAGRTPYVSYTDADVLAGLIHPQTAEPLEVTFIVATQIMELHFQLLIHEWRRCVDRLAAGDVTEARAGLRRSAVVQDSLISSWQLLEPMSVVQYNRFRRSLGKASGFQSFAYRQVEFLLGAKNAHMLHPHVGMPEIHAAVQQSFESPSVYDAAVELLARRGLPVPASVLNRDHGVEHDSPDPGLVECWRLVYTATADGEAGATELSGLADELTAVAERHSTWRFVHYTAVRRILGAKPGTGGSAGLAWLKRAVDTPIFAELWQVRDVL
ncbi:MAG: tryptophan 2,3-dioxygenase [Frankiales bacterium]|nr:tryptophan 2,3-dioxygenase [Frankiales bacterium]